MWQKGYKKQIRYSVYLLCEPDKEALIVRYIGRSRNLEGRFDSRQQTYPQNRPMMMWLQNLRAKGLKPEVVVEAEGLTLVQAKRLEKKLGKQYVKNLLLTQAKNRQFACCLLSPEHWKALRREAKAKRITVSGRMRELIELGLKQEDHPNLRDESPVPPLPSLEDRSCQDSGLEIPGASRAG